MTLYGYIRIDLIPSSTANSSCSGQDLTELSNRSPMSSHKVESYRRWTKELLRITVAVDRLKKCYLSNPDTNQRVPVELNSHDLTPYFEVSTEVVGRILASQFTPHLFKNENDLPFTVPDEHPEDQDLPRPFQDLPYLCIMEDPSTGYPEEMKTFSTWVYSQSKSLFIASKKCPSSCPRINRTLGFKHQGIARISTRVLGDS